MTISIQFETSNAAFEDPGEIPRILHEIAENIGNGRLAGRILDINGNPIGNYAFQRQPRAEIQEYRAKVTEGETSSGSLKLEDIVEGIKKLIPEGMYDEFQLYDDSPDDEATRSGIFEEIIDHLNEIAPEGLSFGASEGDGASFGFWKTDDAEQERMDELALGYETQ